LGSWKIKLDYIIVGSGLFGSVFAWYAKQAGKKILILEKRFHRGGNLYCEEREGINVHSYGAHIFHTSNKEIWNFVNSFVPFNHYINSPLALYKGKLYNLPFNMNTFHALWGVTKPEEAQKIIRAQKDEAAISEPKNLEEQAISLVGKDIYEILVKEYTEKQWSRKCTELPPFIIKRLPVRFTFDNNYFNDPFQGIPIGGYNRLIDGLLENVEVKTNTDFFQDRSYWEAAAEKIVFSGRIDEFYEYRFGKLEYRSLRFDTEVLDCENFQGNAVINYSEASVPYTRIIEHKHFEFGVQPKTVITREYPCEWQEGSEPYYPINDLTNNNLYQKYQELAKKDTKTIFGGRLGEYKYYDMDQVIASAFDKYTNECP
jgi:UDP-galactopyranose mutase